MKTPLLLLATLLALNTNAQKTTSFYDFLWKATDVKHARFYTELEHTDSGWHRIDYYVQGPLQMEGLYEDSACKRRSGHFIFAYPNKILESTGSYVHNKRQGLWLTYHPNGMMADSTTYANGQPVGRSQKWYQNGNPEDSANYNADGSGVEVSWFENGNPSSAGRWAAGHKKQGRWQFFHSNGHLSALELYDTGRLVDKQYFDENGQVQKDTTANDRKASFSRDSTAWLKYLGKHLSFPDGYKITNGDMAAVVVSFTVDEQGNVKDAYISVPFYPPFEKEAINTIQRSPKWQPAIEHNRYVRWEFRQPVVFAQPE